MACGPFCLTEINFNILSVIYVKNSLQKIAYSTKCQPHQPANWLNDCLANTLHSGRAVWAMNCLRSFELWVRGSQHHLGHGCLYAFILCLC
jgi:hypothetical protein